MSDIFAIEPIIDKTGWTYEEYMQQPSDLIDAMIVKMRVKSVIEQRESERMKAEMSSIGPKRH